MVPIVTKSGKQKPPTPPKPIQYQPVSYKRLIDSKYPVHPLLHMGNHNDEVLSDRSLTDETIPLIEEDSERFSVPQVRVKPPLLPKPQHIPPKPPVIDYPVIDSEKKEENRNTNPFMNDIAAESQTDTLKLFSHSFMSQYSRIENNFEISKSSSLDNRIFSNSGTDISNFHSLEEIHQTFNSDKESLLDNDCSNYGQLIRRQIIYDKSNRCSWKSNSDVENGNESRSRSSSINDNDYWLKSSPKSSSSGSPIVKTKLNSTDDVEDRTEGGDDDSLENNSSENSYSVRRRLKTWFGSFGKGNKMIKNRDSTFYIDPENDSKNIWETGSNSSTEDKIENAVDVNSEESIGQDMTSNGIAEPLMEKEKKEKKAFYVVRELISSEKVFIDVLKLLCDDFVNYVKNADRDNPVIPEVELIKIINYLPQLKLFNEELLKDFECRLENWLSFKKISDIIIKKGPFLKLFSTYIQNFEKQCELLDDSCHKYHRFAKVVKDFEMSPRCQKLTLKHYMLKPVQRLPQYRLLLENYLSHQDPESMDYEDTKQALRIVCDVTDHADRSAERGNHFNKLLQIQARLSNYEIIKPGREFVKAGELFKLCRKEMQLRYFILLSDCLLYTSYYGAMFSLAVKYKLPLSGMKVCIPEVEDYHNEFSIISTTRSFTLRAKSPEERKEWCSILDKTIAEHKKKQSSFISPKFVPEMIQAEPLELGKQAPIWVPDGRVTMCQVCTAEFKFAFRRHHCRACGKVVCAICSDNKAPLQYMHFRAARVCDDCYQYLLKEYTDPNNTMVKNIIVQLDLSEPDAVDMYDRIRLGFKKHDPPRLRKLPEVPKRLMEVPANDSGSQMSGWLHQKTRKMWKRHWFVLKEQVLYVYKASKDTRALDTIPVLGYILETFKEVSTSYDDIDSKLVFQLAHVNQSPLVFHAEDEVAAEKWITALQEAVGIA